MDLLHKSCMALGTPESLDLVCECPRALSVASSRHPDASTPKETDVLISVTRGYDGARDPAGTQPTALPPLGLTSHPAPPPAPASALRDPSGK